MSTNYNILLKSEKKLKDLILDYLSLSYEIHFKLWKDIEKYIDSEHKGIIFDNCEKRLRRSEALEDELLDECIWTISKDDPRANHLRFIISIIYTTKDVSRACEYALSIAKIIVRFDIDKKMIKNLRSSIDIYLDHIEKMINFYKSTSHDKFEKFEELNLKFEAKLEKEEKETLKHFSKNELIQSQISRIYRLILSTIERLQSIFSSVVFSKANSSTITTTIENKKSKK